MQAEDAARPSAGARKVYEAVLAGLQDHERSRKASIEQRAIAVITTSGGLVSLLVALSAFLLGKNATVHTFSKLMLVAAIVAFVAASGLGLIVNAPREYIGLTDQDLDRIVAEFTWTGTEQEAARIVAHQRAKEVKVARRVNNRKARQLYRAISLEVLGVALVAVAVLVSLST